MKRAWHPLPMAWEVSWQQVSWQEIRSARPRPSPPARAAGGKASWPASPAPARRQTGPKGSPYTGTGQLLPAIAAPTFFSSARTS